MAAAEDFLVIIQKYTNNLLDATNNDWSNFDKEVDRWRRDWSNIPGPINIWFDATTLMTSKVCVSGFPSEGSDAVKISKRIIYIIFWQIKECNYEDIDTDNLFGLFLNMLVQLLESGPTTGHLAIWNEIFDCTLFKEYYKRLPSEKLQRLLKVLQKNFYLGCEAGIECKQYSDILQKAVLYIVDICITDHHLKSNQEDFVDLFMYYLTTFYMCDPKAFSTMHTLAIKLWYKYDRTPFKGIRNVEFYRKHLQTMLDVLQDNRIPNEEKFIKDIRSTLGYILSGIEAEQMFPDLYMELMNFVMTVCNKTSGITAYQHVEAIGYFWYHLKEDQIKKKTFIFDGMAPKVAELLENLKDPEFTEMRLIKPALYDVLGKVMTNSTEHCILWMRIIKAAVPMQGCAEAVYSAVREQEKFLKWKNHPEAAKEIFAAFRKIDVNYEDERKRKDKISAYENFAKYFLEQLKKNKILPNLFEEIVDFSLSILEANKTHFYELAYRVSDFFDGLVYKTHRTIILSSLKRSTKLLRIDHEWNTKRARALQEITNNSLQAITDHKILEDGDMEVLIDLCDACLCGDFITPDNQPGTEHYRIYVVAVFKTFKLLSDSGDVEKGAELIPKVIGLLEHEEDEVVTMATNQIYILSNGKGGPDALAPHLKKLVEFYLDNEQYMLLSTIQIVYPKNGGVLEEYFQKFFDSLDSAEKSIQTYALQLLAKVAEHQPRLFTEDNVDKILEVMMDGDPHLQVSYLIIVDKLATKRTHIVLHILDNFLEQELNESCFYYQVSILRKIAARSDEKVADRVVNHFINLLKTTDNPTNCLTVLSELRALVATHKPLIDKRKSFFEDMKKTSSNQTVIDILTSLIDQIEGRSLETIADDLENQQGEIDNLDTRVTSNENNINTVKVEVGKQRKDIKVIKKDVKEQGEKIDDISEVVDETVKKVEEIDQKTLSHAPYWSRDVSKLLNPESEHDWRLLSSRLGYSNDDIRAWAQQSDPCMAMLNEWYSTHKTSEASFGVLNALQEMNRMDAAIIVENAMKAADQVVEDEEFEYASPPPIFLSYQWGHQDEVKLIRQHLEMAGYECWMDIGQMGGGDKLFEKIDKGIRAAKVIISCTTEKYSKSPNCNREVNLSVNLKKPIIPLLLEDCQWPPEGSMGPIFSEYLYIQFYQSTSEEKTNDNRFWPVPKFQELLMQLSMNGIVPDESKVDKMYKNWWIPLVEEIKIDKSKTSGVGKKEIKSINSKTDDAIIFSNSRLPEVFISYQWGKQKNIMLLYKRLTELGYNCWMDIHQMGGGDSLYDKIDRGIRGCKVVISCLTEKYALSANCRREVSLSDALKRPIIPLLLEQMNWPPKGPMSMTFTDLLYIDMHSEPKSQETWDDPKFEELRNKIRQNIGKVEDIPDKQSSEEKSPTVVAQDGEPSIVIEAQKPEPLQVTETQESAPLKDKEPHTSKSFSSESKSQRKTSYVKSATAGTKVRTASGNQTISTPTSSGESQSPKSPTQDKRRSSSTCIIL